MEIRIIKISDLDQIREWLPEKFHNSELPRHTFVATDEGHVVAFAGLRMAEGPICFIESMASNPGFVGALRNEALDLLTSKICETAKELGFKGLMAWTKDESILRRSEKHGFRCVPQILISKEL